MASNLAKAKAAGDFYVTINSNYGKQWRDFTLQRGHVYGYSPELDGEDDMTGMFVVYREVKNGIILYVSRMGKKNGTNDRYIWYRHAIHKDSRTGEAIMPVLRKRRGGVERRPLAEQDITTVYNPPLIKTKYTPMPSMRIPGGAEKTIVYEESTLITPGNRLTTTELAIKNSLDQHEWRKHHERAYEAS